MDISSIFVKVAEQCLTGEARETAVTLSNRFERQGEIRGKKKLLSLQLQHKFGDLSSDHQQLLEIADAEQLFYWGKLLLDAKSLDEVFGTVAC